MANQVLDAALEYAALGYKVFPCKPSEKKPLRSGWQESATSDPDELKNLFSSPDLNIGWAIEENMMVLDVDLKAGLNGFQSLESLERQHGTLPVGPNQETPSGGNHLLFSLPAGVMVPNSVGKVGHGLDVRSAGGYIVLAPSSIVGKPYSWGMDAPWLLKSPIAPDWLIELAIHGSKQKVSTVGATFGQGERNSGLTSLAGSMRKRGMGESTICAALLEENKIRCMPPLPEPEVLQIAKSVAGYPASGELILARAPADWLAAIEEAATPDQVVEVARQFAQDDSLSRTAQESLLKQAARAAGVSSKVLKSDLQGQGAARGGEVLPVVDVSKADFAATVDAAARVLGGILEVYQRAGELVEVIARPDRGDVIILPIAPARLSYLLARACRWRHGESGDGSPPPDVVASLMAAGYWPGVRPLAGLLNQPTIGQGGGIIGAGYDPESMRLSVFDPAQFPAYTGAAALALAELKALLSGFAWASPLDESAAIGAILTAALRPALATAPAFLVAAPDMGSGKTYLAQVIGQFSGGITTRRWPREEIECAKTLFAILLEGRPCTLFDNMTRNWQSESLETALTSSTYSDRAMSTHRSVEVSTACLILGTGNNVQAVADLARRVVTIKLDARVECPAARHFQTDPMAEVTAMRGRWVMLALRIIQGWIEVGRPHAALPVVGSFGQWSEFVRQPLVWLGLPDPAANLINGLNEDSDRELLERLIENWSEAYMGQPVSLRELLIWSERAAQGTPESAIRQVLEEVAFDRGEVNARKVGQWLARCAGRVVGGKRLEKGERTKHGLPWRVVRV